MKINMHVHSNYSLDGEYDVNSLIDILKEKGFEVISITDHNSCGVYKDIKTESIKIVPGLEADAIINNQTYDFLCYDFDVETVSKYVTNQYGTVEQRQQKIFNKLIDICNQNKIDLIDIDTYNPSEEYAHFALFRMIDKTFLDKYNIIYPGDLYRLSTMDKSFPLYIDMHLVWPDIKELQNIIHNNGGKIFLAHPYRYNQSVEKVLNDVRDYVDGIEICNNPKDEKEVEYLYKFAKENNLLVSCGSDYHGDQKYSIECDYLTEDMIKDVLSWIK